ncbi:hypothetical protein GCM10010275_20140 [Streptomyces litmocidini]|uniref:hypothetical protein n=1 Tax=Streptomyces litmocidini TaxID=67318 RepID=UPI00167D3143|nr:hypothetical protein [Streptomyces litmocidini]GGU84922.1 hypothetical protein GCM10010275_20140 [Streptomyces litmocidini]
MRKAMWVAAAAGVALLVAGCGSEGGTDKGGSSSAGSAATGGSGAGGSSEQKLDAAAVTKELTDAATGAGFTQDSSGEAVPPALKDCMVSWTADAEKAADPKKSYADTVSTLTGGGWTVGKSLEQMGSQVKSLTKSTWRLQASNHSQGPLKIVMFVATDAGPECEAVMEAENAKHKKP